MTRPYENLINAIILQAVKDYRDALKRLKKKPQNTDAMSTAMEIERFFFFFWYQTSTSVDLGGRRNIKKEKAKSK